ncbi:hypothetical protein O9X98_06690 [Agrobacterium salinitolerans]|nr:hypothetical protein [Agrobacterium salinitolerans]
MSFDTRKTLCSLTGIGERIPTFVLLAGSLQNAEKWEALIEFIRDEALEYAETGYDTEPLRGDFDLLCYSTFEVLKNMGVTIPAEFPKELETGDGNYGDDDTLSDIVLNQNPFSSLILKIYKSLNDVYGFYAAYVSRLEFDDELGLMETPAENMYSSLIDLAAAKVQVDRRVATRFGKFQRETEDDFEEWLNVVKERAVRAGVPLRAELMDLVHFSHEALGEEAERESFGYSSSRPHPDIYMNELLCGMRDIRRVLPAILKKLGIEDEMNLETPDPSLYDQAPEPGVPSFEGDSAMTVIPLSPEAIKLLELQKEKFVIQFGREPGPDDPVFFDVDVETPTQLELTSIAVEKLDFGAEPVHLLHATVGFDRLDRKHVIEVAKVMGEALGFQIKPFHVFEDRATYKLERTAEATVGHVTAALKAVRSTPPVNFADLWLVHDDVVYVFECDDEVRVSFK